MYRRFSFYFVTQTLLSSLIGVCALAVTSWAGSPASLGPNEEEAEVMKLPSIRQMIGAEDKTSTLRLDNSVQDKKIRTKKYQHYYRGLEVIGSMSMSHHGPNGAQISDRLARFDLDTTPNLTPGEALSLAGLADGGSGDDNPRSAPELKILPALSGDASARLVYIVQLRKQIIVDAQTGEIVAVISPEETLAPINIYSAASTGKLIPETKYDQMKKTDKTSFAASQCQIIDQVTGDPFLVDPQFCNSGNDASSQRASNFAQVVLNYYQNTFNRNSYDGNGAAVVGIVHAGFKYDNALWNTDTRMIAYGDGDGITYGDFTQALDVTGHEITHGITASTAKLLMIGESGSINEAFSDFFGRMIANDGLWSMGKDLFIDPNSPGLRDLANPASITFSTKNANGVVTHSGTYPDNISRIVTTNPGEKCDLESNDNCFVHINSTILSHASYLVYQAIGKARAEELYFTTLTQKLTATSTMRTTAQSVVDACALLYDQATCSEVAKAYSEVGISTSAAAPVTPSNGL
jgi:Zn-dependent metalloprotease